MASAVGVRRRRETGGESAEVAMMGHFTFDPTDGCVSAVAVQLLVSGGCVDGASGGARVAARCSVSAIE
jgi:hypothetical protein